MAVKAMESPHANELSISPLRGGSLPKIIIFFNFALHLLKFGPVVETGPDIVYTVHEKGCYRAGIIEGSRLRGEYGLAG